MSLVTNDTLLEKKGTQADDFGKMLAFKVER